VWLSITEIQFGQKTSVSFLPPERAVAFKETINLSTRDLEGCRGSCSDPREVTMAP
jgi:hypothetical protein